jgi:hypothetical protein
LSGNERVLKIEKRYDFNFFDDAQFNIIVFPILRRVILNVDNFNYDKFLEILERISFIATIAEAMNLKPTLKLSYAL